MTAKSVIGECLLKMGLADFTKKNNQSDTEKELIEALLGALNIAYREVVCEYLPLVEKEKVVFNDGELLVSNIAKRILYPIRLTRGDQVKNFKVYPDKIVADIEGEATLEYAYVPTLPFTITSNINDLRLTQSALSDGTLAEYYFANKVFDLAKNFDASFRSKMGVLRYKGRRMRLKQRGWTD
ncbi:MAG: hypothetical protein NC037_06160 [Bacteroides sp.]|nr:hypothetical protein [Bacillota bacterium]MCM1393813.1 hypothetical protein [[Eubacterium] siraeum]MCM1456088.1 hypothetical protein [Bacteroides sp.]